MTHIPDPPEDPAEWYDPPGHMVNPHTKMSGHSSEAIAAYPDERTSINLGEVTAELRTAYDRGVAETRQANLTAARKALAAVITGLGIHVLGGPRAAQHVAEAILASGALADADKLVRESKTEALDAIRVLLDEAFYASPTPDRRWTDDIADHHYWLEVLPFLLRDALDGDNLGIDGEVDLLAEIVRNTTDNPCGHRVRVDGCGGCDPGAIAAVRYDDGRGTISGEGDLYAEYRDQDLSQLIRRTVEAVERYSTIDGPRFIGALVERIQTTERERAAKTVEEMITAEIPPTTMRHLTSIIRRGY